MKTADLKEIYDSLDGLEDITRLIETAIEEESPISIKEGGIIKTGYNETVDKYRNAKTEGKQWLAQMEQTEREKTGIKNLRIKFNKVFGYYLEVTNSYKDLVPKEWNRKQTMANAERYITPELKELEDMILGAEEKLFSLEYDLFAMILGSDWRRGQTDSADGQSVGQNGCLCFTGLRGRTEPLCSSSD